MELVTERLVLREYAADDFDAVHRFASDPETTRFVAWGPNTPEQTRGFIEYWLEDRAATPRTRYTFAITEPGGEPFGSVGIYQEGPHEAETGFVVSPRPVGSRLRHRGRPGGPPVRVRGARHPPHLRHLPPRQRRVLARAREDGDEP